MFITKHKSKIFCIGFNKTGTTSLEKVLNDFGYKLGNQAKGELLFFDWLQRDFTNIVKFCKTADAFQDIPFSLPYTYIALDQYFEGSKFILTVRDSADQWYDSITKFHTKLFAQGKLLPAAVDLQNATYRYKGYTYESFKGIFGTADDNLYDETSLKKVYSTHNSTVLDYFKNKKDQLLVINISNPGDYQKLCDFLGKKPIHDDFPWENKTETL